MKYDILIIHGSITSNHMLAQTETSLFAGSEVIYYAVELLVISFARFKAILLPFTRSTIIPKSNLNVSK